MHHRDHRSIVCGEGRTLSVGDAVLGAEFHPPARPLRLLADPAEVKSENATNLSFNDADPMSAIAADDALRPQGGLRPKASVARLVGPPYPAFSKANAFMQYRNPVGGGPSGKTWPRWASQMAQVASMRVMPWEKSPT